MVGIQLETTPASMNVGTTTRRTSLLILVQFSPAAGVLLLLPPPAHVLPAALGLDEAILSNGTNQLLDRKVWILHPLLMLSCCLMLADSTALSTYVLLLGRVLLG